MKVDQRLEDVFRKMKLHVSELIERRTVQSDREAKTKASTIWT
jgi:hypothetical protein